MCLGAKAVGLGRPFLYAQGVSALYKIKLIPVEDFWDLQAYGEAGVQKIINILHREIVTAMRLVGVAKISDLTLDMVSAYQLLMSNMTRPVTG